MFKELGVGTLEVSRNAAAKGGIVKCENRYRLVLGLRTELVLGPPLTPPVAVPHIQAACGVRPCQDRCMCGSVWMGSHKSKFSFHPSSQFNFVELAPARPYNVAKASLTASSCLSCQRTQVYYVSFIHNSLQIYFKSFQRLSG